MKKAITLSTLVLLAITSLAQERYREPGITFYDLNSFGFSYKTGLPSALWRFNSVYIGGNREKQKDEYSQSKASSGGAAFMAGREFRKMIADKIEFRYGMDVTFHYSYTRNENAGFINPNNKYIVKVNTYNPGLAAIIGVNYLASPAIILGAELSPGFSYRTSKRVSTQGDEKNVSETSGFSFRAASSSIMFTAAYRFIR